MPPSIPIQNTWAYRELVRIEALPNADLILEVHNAINGHNYSWKSIQTKLRHLNVDYSLYLEWDTLCHLKRTWETFPSLTRDKQHEDIVASLSRDDKAWNPKYLRTLLVNLRLIPIRAGVEEMETIQLVTQNINESSKFNL
ncbi:hypothetical protein EG329_004549 [Mollisiaceae sp. DMI_Dod_QoI]|nr:hypothetical protein EG329_004549 [Helotiales sp. DMI_Dod_QoI]